MSYTLSSSLSEVLSSLLASKAKAIEKAEALKAQQEEEAEAARTRGTPVTTEAFEAWRKKFLLERKIAKQKVEAESLKALTPKEREERRKFETRLTGLPTLCRFVLKKLSDHRQVGNFSKEERSMQMPMSTAKMNLPRSISRNTVGKKGKRHE